MGAFLQKILGWLAPFFLNWAWEKLQAYLRAREEKKREDKKIDDAANKVKDGDLKDGLDGTNDLEEIVNEDAK